MAVALTSAVSLMNPDGETSADDDRTFRKFMASLWLPDPSSANPLSARGGVLPHNFDGNGCTSLRPQAKSTASMDIEVLAGPSIVPRAGQGPYLVFGEESVFPTIPTSDPNNPRWDVVYAWVGDQSVNGSTDPLHGPVVDVLEGTAAASPTVPTTLPDGAVALAQVYVGTNVAQITAADVHDVRKSTSLAWANRYMLPGDSINDPGRADGELRYRTASDPFPSLTDYWDATQGRWRGTQGFVITAPFPGTPDAANHKSGTLSAARTRIITATVPDPGYAYRLGTNAYLRHNNGADMNYFIAVNNGPFSSQIVTVSDVQDVVLIPNSDVIFTGNSTVQLTADILSNGPGAWFTDARNVMTIRVDPA